MGICPKLRSNGGGIPRNRKNYPGLAITWSGMLRTPMKLHFQKPGSPRPAALARKRGERTRRTRSRKSHEGQDDRMRQNKLRAARSAAYRMECPCAPLFARASHPVHPVHPVNSQRPLRLCARRQKYLGSSRELPRATHVHQQLRLVPRQQ